MITARDDRELRDKLGAICKHLAIDANCVAADTAEIAEAIRERLTRDPGVLSDGHTTVGEVRETWDEMCKLAEECAEECRDTTAALVSKGAAIIDMLLGERGFIVLPPPTAPEIDAARKLGGELRAVNFCSPAADAIYTLLAALDDAQATHTRQEHELANLLQALQLALPAVGSYLTQLKYGKQAAPELVEEWSKRRRLMSEAIQRLGRNRVYALQRNGGAASLERALAESGTAANADPETLSVPSPEDQIFFAALDAHDVPRKPLAVYDSNSYRRVGLAPPGSYEPIVYAYRQRIDGHLDIAGTATLRAMVAAYNAMLARAPVATEGAANG